MSRRTARQRFCAVLALTAVAALPACGSRVDRESIAAVGNGYGPATAGQSVAGGSTEGTALPGADGGVVPDGSAPTGETGVVGAVEAGPGGAGGTTGGSDGGAVAPGAPGGGGTAGAAPGAPGAPGAGGGAPAAGSNAAAAASCPKQLSPVVVGQTLASSGLIGASIGRMRDGLSIWAQDVNARGGVQCHPVRLFQLDDASDPSRVQANWNELTKQRKAVAVLAGGAPVAIAALRSVAERDKIPVVGGDLVSPEWNQSPYLFPQGGASLGTVDGPVVEAARSTAGPDKAGLIYCTEASSCTAIKNHFPKAVKRAGAAAGPIKAASLTQTDYTAECQEQKTAGTTVLLVGLDGSALQRVLRSCAQLDYFPVAGYNLLGTSKQNYDANVRRNTWLGALVLPFLETSETQGGRDFGAAVKKYAGSVEPDGAMITGYAAGKLFEAALAKVADQARAGDITTKMVLDGLWRLKDEKLQGLSPGVTFDREQPPTVKNCYYAVNLTKDGFRSLGSKPRC